MEAVCDCVYNSTSKSSLFESSGSSDPSAAAAGTAAGGTYTTNASATDKGWSTTVTSGPQTIKYTPEEGTISVSLREEDGDIVWRVKDNGVGIPEEDQEHIFERFYRVDKARGRDTGGTGLGLSIVKQMVKMHGGTITVHSEPGKGSEFVVMFPQEGAAS